MPKKSWNITDETVYSLVSKDTQTFNMNIYTYVTAISMKPKLYAIGVYHNTKTLENLFQNELCVLQILGKSHFIVVKHLGYKRGKAINKMNLLQKKELLMPWNEFDILKNCAAVMLLKKKTDMDVAGDHQLFIFEVLQQKVFNLEYLSLNDLRAKKIIRI